MAYACGNTAGAQTWRPCTSRPEGKEMQDVWSHPAFHLSLALTGNIGLEDNLQCIGSPEELPVVQVRQVEVQLYCIVSHLHNPWPSEDDQRQHNQRRNHSRASRVITIITIITESHSHLPLFLVALCTQRVSAERVAKIVSGVNALPCSHALRLRSSSSKRMPLLQVSHLFCP